MSEITCWLDRTVVLYWLQGTETYKQFVANRVTKIQSHENVVWRYVPTGEYFAAAEISLTRVVNCG